MKALADWSSYDDSGLSRPQRRALIEFLTEGRHPGEGSLIEALLVNDLATALRRSSDDGALRQAVAWLRRHAPWDSYGSKRAVARHCARLAVARRLQQLGAEVAECPYCRWRLAVAPAQTPRDPLCAVCRTEVDLEANVRIPADEAYEGAYYDLVKRLGVEGVGSG